MSTSIDQPPAWIRYGFRLLLGALYGFFLFVNPFAFHYEVGITYYHDVFPFCLAMLLLAILVAVVYSFRFSVLDLFFVLLVGAFLLMLVLNAVPGLLSNEYLCVSVYMLVVYLVVRMTRITLADRWVSAMLTISFLYELIIGVTQAFTGDHAWGTLLNTGVFSCYLVAHIPLLYFLVHDQRLPLPRQVRWGVFLLLFVAVVILIWLNGSRTAILSLLGLVAVGVVQAVRTITIKQSYRIAGLSLLLLAIASVGYFSRSVFLAKKLSASGRLMKLAICTGHIGDSLWLGLGPGKFTYHYPQWQAQYFCSHTDVPVHYFLSADESYLLFNEYMQLFFDTGMIGLALVGIIVYDFLRAESRQQQAIQRLAKYTVLVILSFGFTSYPFHCTPFLFLMMVCLATVHAGNERSSFLHTQISHRGVIALATLLFALLVGAGLVRSVQRCRNVHAFMSIYGDYFTNPAVTAARYETLYPALRDDGKFLVAYGEFLTEEGNDLPKGIALLEESKRWYISYRTFNSLARAYTRNNQPHAAARQFIFLSCFIPNDFYPRHELVKLLHTMGDTARLQTVGTALLEMPVKAPSAEVEHIKREVRTLLGKP